MTVDKPPRRVMRIVAIGDVGVVDRVIHVGDEAMFEALVRELRSRGVDGIVGVSSNPADTSQRYGIRAVPRIFLPGTRAELAGRMSRVLAAATGAAAQLAPGDRAWEVIRAIAASDGVAIAGGGNLASTWPVHIYERATLGALARLAGKPLVVTGQTLGPDLSDDDSALVRSLLDSAALVGVRESSSLALARSWGLAGTVSNVDDASFLADDVSPGRLCVVTLSTHLGSADRDLVIDRVVELLDSVDLEPAFLAHYGSMDPAITMGDSVLHEVVRERTGGSVIPVTSAREAAAVARGASLVVTSRYHPAVFAVAAGVPVLGIPVDEYTRVKLAGALGNGGQSGILPVESLLAGRGPDAAAAVMAQATRPLDRAPFDAWWDRVAAVFAT